MDAMNSTEFSPRVRVFLGATIAAGLMVILWAASGWRTMDWTNLGLYCALAVITATWKVRLPETTVTVSPSYVIGLLAMAQTGIAESILVLASAAMMQTVWRPKAPPRAVQVAFNGASAAVASAAAWTASHWLRNSATDRQVLVMIVGAALTHYLVTTLLLAVLFCLAEKRPLMSIWSVCNFWVLPHYAIGATLAGVIVVLQRRPDWLALPLAMAILVLLVGSYRARVAAYQESS